MDGIFTAGWFRFPQGDGSAARARIKDLLARRIATQPLSLPNAGSVFPQPAGRSRRAPRRVLRPQGPRDRRCARLGDARELHREPGGKARAADIEALIAHVRDAVKTKTGVDLTPEVRSRGEPMTISARSRC
jgi:UDP-N-acetylmuramate dehydrogenase